MPFNQELPEWNAVGTKPPQSKLDAGWQIGERPPSGWWNWALNRTYLAIQELQNEAINIDQKGVANGLATLDASGKVPASQLNVSAPPDATTSTKGVVQLSNSTTSTSETLAATPKAVKTVDDKIGTLSGLNTTAKDNLVNAVNELFTFANDGKTKWSSVIGSPLVSSDTFAQMQTKTQTIKDTLATNLTAKGQPSAGSETLNALVNKVSNVITGKRVLAGLATSNGSTYNVNVSGLGFTPGVVLVKEKNQGSKTLGFSVYANMSGLGLGAMSNIDVYYGVSGTTGNANTSVGNGYFQIFTYSPNKEFIWVAVEQ